MAARRLAIVALFLVSALGSIGARASSCLKEDRLRLIEQVPSAETHRWLAEATVQDLKQNGIEATLECLEPPQINCLVLITPSKAESLKGRHWMTRMATALRKKHDLKLVLDTKTAVFDRGVANAYYSPGRRILAMDWADLEKPHAGAFTLHEGRHLHTDLVAAREAASGVSLTSPQRSAFPIVEFAPGSDSKVAGSLGPLYPKGHRIDEIDAYAFTAQTGLKYAHRLAASGSMDSLPTIDALLEDSADALATARRFIQVDRQLLETAITELSDVTKSGARYQTNGNMYVVILSDKTMIRFWLHQITRARGAQGLLTAPEITRFLRENLTKIEEYRGRLNALEATLNEPMVIRLKR